MRLSLVVLLQLLFLSTTLPAQRERNVWWFGAGAGIDFSSLSPSPIRTSIAAYEGCAVMCDGKSGVALMATDGRRVYNAEGDVMPNGEGLAGLDNATQSSLIIPAPQRPGLYYIFTQDGAAYSDPPNVGLCYSLVDMSLDGGRGAVTLKNVQLIANTAEKLAAVRDTSGCGFWVLTHGTNDNAFHAFHLTADGIDSAVVSAVGTPHIDPSNETVGGAAIGWMRFSPDGQRVAVASYTAGFVELLDFDKSNGRIANPLLLPSLPYAYGLCFSPDGTKLYVSTNSGNRTPQNFTLWQFDVSSEDSAAIAGTMTLVTRGPDPVARHFGALQMGPDGKIYMARAGDRWLSVIEFPNAPGAACGFRRDGFDLGFAGASTFSLPNFVDDMETRGGLDCSLPHADFLLSDTIICVGSCVDAVDRSLNAPTSWEWHAPGAVPSSSIGRAPEPFCFPAAGRWPIHLVVANGDGVDTAERWVTVVEGGVLRGHIELLPSTADTIAARVIIDRATGILPEPITLRLAYPPGILRYAGALAGELAHDWSIDLVDRDDVNGAATIRLLPPSGVAPDRPGHLVDLRLALFLDTLDRIPLEMTMTGISPGCPTVSEARMDIDAPGCLRQERMMEIGAGTYALGGPDPSPSSTRTTLDLTLGLDGQTRVSIHTIDGRAVTVPVSSWMDAGRHRLPLDLEGLPSGLYLIIVHSGAWSAERRLIVR